MKLDARGFLEFASVREMRAHYRSVAARMKALRAPEPPPMPAPPPPKPKPVAAVRVVEPPPMLPPLPPPPPIPSPVQRNRFVREIVETCGGYFGFPPEQVCGLSRSLDVVTARHLACMFTYELCSMSTPQVARAIGRDDHSTVVHALYRMRVRMGEPEFTRIVGSIRRKLES